MTTIDVPTTTLIKSPPADTNPAMWQRLNTHVVALIAEVQGPRRPDQLSLFALRAVTLLRQLGVRVDVASPDRKPARPKAASALKLTERELEVLRGMGDGKSNAEIGRDLFVSEDTVKTHARRMFRKIGAKDRAHAVATGFRLELLT